MVPEFRRAETSDGVSIAFWTLGSGHPLLIIQSPFGQHLEFEWSIAQNRTFYERLAAGSTVIRFDGRGLGVSQRNVDDISLEALQLDIDAVLDALQVTDCAILVRGLIAPLGIAYASNNPRRVSHLILWNSLFETAAFFLHSQAALLNGLVEQDWKLYIQAVVSVWRDWTPAKDLLDATRQAEAAVEPAFYKRLLTVLNEKDSRPSLDRITCPTLVLCEQSLSDVLLDQSQALAKRISGARLLLYGAEDEASTYEPEVPNSILQFIFGQEFIEMPADRLSARESEIVRLLRSGLANKEIAVQLGISPHTVERHLANVYRKLNVHSRIRAALRSRG